MTLLELENVDAGYGESHVLDKVSMEVNDGEVVSLLGRNGAGKTTTLRSIVGICEPSNGAIRFKGADLVGKERYEISRQGIGYTPEDRRIFPNLTVQEHIRMVVDKEYRSLSEELERTYDIFPPLEALSDRKGEHLSGGEQQMLAIARALVGETELLLLDEPSEGLAPKIVQSVFRTIQRIKSETTILLVEQNYPLARQISDRYYIIDNGEIVSNGDIQRLEEQPELKEKYLGVT
jgi:branched-chain amino acid transport system ATP-binding protein